MQIFVQSRGISTDYGYNWVDENETIIEKPDILKNFIDLLQESLSLLIARKNGELLLLVTGIPSSRKDYQNRVIFISVAWIVKDNADNETKIRNLASKILFSFIPKNDLKQKIESCVIGGGKNGFTVDFEPLRQLLDQGHLDPAKAELESKLDVKSDEKIEKLAKDLKNYFFPKQEMAPLVVVTGIQTYADFKQAKVLRGLANFVDEPGGQPKEGDNFRADNKKNNTRQIEGEVRRMEAKYAGMDQGKIKRIIVPVLAVFLCISLSLNIWLYTQSNQQNQKIKAQNEKIESLNQQIQTLTLEGDNVKNR